MPCWDVCKHSGHKGSRVSNQPLVAESDIKSSSLYPPSLMIPVSYAKEQKGRTIGNASCHWVTRSDAVKTLSPDDVL